MPRLLVNPGTASEWVIPLKQGTNVVGRAAGCDVQIEHGSVSSRHCEIVVNGNSVIVRDLGSTNGTFLERAAIVEAALTPGQHLQLGSVDMRCEPDATAATAPAPVVRLSVAAVASAAPASGAPAPSAATSATPALQPSRLRVAAHEAPAAPPSAPVSVLVDEYSMPVEGPAMCKYHPKSAATYLCPQCQLNFCDLCVASRPGGSRTGKFCRRCSTECVARAVPLMPAGALTENFFSQVAGAFGYPFKGNGPFMLVIGALGMALLDFFSMASVGLLSFRVLVIRVFIFGYVYAFMQKVIQGTAQGDDKPPDWPDFGAFWDDIVLPFLQLLTAFLVSFGPALGLLIWIGWDAVTGQAGSTGFGLKALLLLPVFLAGAVYFPMGLLAVAMFDSVAAINPLVVVPAILKAAVEYLVVLIVGAAIVGMLVAKAFLFAFLGTSLAVVVSLLATGTAFYLFLVMVRLLGLLYRAKRQKLGWFERT